MADWPLPVRTAGARLGCGQLEAKLYSPSGRVIGNLGASTIDFNRDMDRYSLCVCTAITKGNRTVQAVRSWEHEIEITRDGVPVWAGPVTGYSELDGVATVTASDVTAWSQVDVVRNDRTYLEIDWSLIALDLLFELSMPGVRTAQPEVHLSDVLGTLDLQRSHLWTTADAIKQAATFIDWTTINRTVIIDGRPSELRPIVGTISDDHIVTKVRTWSEGFQDPDIIWIRGGGGLVGRFPLEGHETLRGPKPVEIVMDRSDLVTQSDVDAAAKTTFGGFSGSLHFEIGANTRLLPDTPITFDNLVPSRIVRVVLKSGRAQPLAGLQKIVGIRCRAGAGDQPRDVQGRFTTSADAAMEQITITLAAMNATGTGA